MIAGLDERKCVTRNMPVHGFVANVDFNDHLYIYGSDRIQLQKLQDINPQWSEQLHANLPFTGVEVVWAVRNEMARTLEDVLARRVRALFLDARASIEMCPEVARLMATEMGYNETWIKNQIAEYINLAKGYMLE